MRYVILLLSFLTASILGADAAVDTSFVHPVKVYEKKGYSTGTAFFIDAHRLLTAAHVITGRTIVVLIDGKEIPCRLIRIETKGDVDCALLETDYTSPTCGVLASEVTIAGFPSETGPLQQNTGDTTKTFKTNNTIIPGMSGCPLLQNGFVVGMGVSFHWTNPKKSCNAIPANRLRAFIGETK